jgi:hypothetical protein
MAYVVTEFQETPNPNAVKCVLDRTIATVPRSYRDATEAKNDAIALALFGLAGVTNLLFIDNWVSVGKTSKTSWASLKTGIRRILGEGP